LDPNAQFGCSQAPGGYSSGLSVGEQYAWNMFYVSTDGKYAAYPVHTGAICASTDGGKTWKETAIKGADAMGNLNLMAFSNDKVGCALSSEYDTFATPPVGHYYIACTADSGATWNLGKLPTITVNDAQTPVLKNIFFAPDGKTGFIVGNTSSGSDPTAPV